MDIFWIQDGQRQGPLPEVEIISGIQRGELDPEIKGWHQGSPGWVPLKELPALAPYMKKGEASSFAGEEGDISIFEEKETCDPEEEAAQAIKIIVVPSPSLRFLAKVVDMMLVLVIGFSPIPLFNPPYHEVYLFFLVWLLLIPYETFFIHFFGTTPGKALLNIRVLTRRECRPDLKQSMMRALYVYITGFGFMAPILVLIMPLLSWFFIRKHKMAAWDMKLDLVCFVSGRIPFWRILLSVWVALTLAQLAGTELMLWRDGILKSWQEASGDTTVK